MGGFIDDARKLFSDFASRHGLIIETITQDNIELMMSVPRQEGLVFELTLCLQNQDEISIGFSGFWSYVFPFDEQKVFIANVLDDLVVGNARLAVFKQFGRVVYRDLEQKVGDKWSRIYREYCKIRVPFGRLNKSYVVNEARTL